MKNITNKTRQSIKKILDECSTGPNRIMVGLVNSPGWGKGSISKLNRLMGPKTMRLGLIHIDNNDELINALGSLSGTVILDGYDRVTTEMQMTVLTEIKDMDAVDKLLLVVNREITPQGTFFLDDEAITNRLLTFEI